MRPKIEHKMNTGQIIGILLTVVTAVLSSLIWFIVDYNNLKARLTQFEGASEKINYEEIASFLMRDHSEQLRGPPGDPGADAIGPSPTAVAEALFSEYSDALVGPQGMKGEVGESPSSVEIAEMIIENYSEQIRGDVGPKGNDGISPSPEEVANVLIDHYQDQIIKPLTAELAGSLTSRSLAKDSLEHNFQRLQNDFDALLVESQRTDTQVKLLSKQVTDLQTQPSVGATEGSEVSQLPNITSTAFNNGLVAISVLSKQLNSDGSMLTITVGVRNVTNNEMSIGFIKFNEIEAFTEAGDSLKISINGLGSRSLSVSDPSNYVPISAGSSTVATIAVRHSRNRSIVGKTLFIKGNLTQFKDNWRENEYFQFELLNLKLN